MHRHIASGALLLWAFVGCGAGCGSSEAGTAAPDSAPADATPDTTVQVEYPPADYVYADYDPHPEPPAIVRDVALIDDDVAFTQPYVPGHRTTMDGRVAIRVQGGPPGTERVATSLSFFLFAPEKLADPIMAGPPGAEILADATPVDVLFPPALEPNIQVLGHHAICDPTEEFAVVGERPNPYSCGSGLGRGAGAIVDASANAAHDCYDVTVISSTSLSPGIESQLWGTPVTIEVSDPKTAQARIVSVVLGEPVAGTRIQANQEWTEPAVTIDGRLMTGRLGRFPRTWVNPNTGEEFLRPYDLAYSVLPLDADPCDITGWVDFHPMSHAPHDPEMVARYGLAAYPFRDSEGVEIPDGEDVGGTYPWVDREGANVFMAGVPGRIVEQSESRYPRRCVVAGCESFSENIDWDRGFLVAGLWTHGKFVHLDAMINNQDWAVGVAPQTHFLVDLYRDAAGSEVPIRFGAGRFIDEMRYAGGPYPPGYTHNANILDSLQNLPNFAPNAQPVTPRDVVWVMSTGVATDEVAFDDLLDPNAFIVSTMQASITQIYDDQGRSTAFPEYHNGQVRTLTPLGLPLPELFVLHPEEDADIHIQNGATSLQWDVPSYGLVRAGTARAEPVALGGVQGRGLWLSGDAEVRYAVPAQTRDIAAHDWYVGIFVDPRSAAEELRVLARFPDGSEIHLAGHALVRYLDRAGAMVHQVALPAGVKGWMHLGWQLRQGNRDIVLLHNGLALDRFVSPDPMMQMTQGDFVLAAAPSGGPGKGFRGWIDELVVLAHDVNPEVACNHARGTLVRVSLSDVGAATPAGAWAGVAAAHPEWAHADVAAAAGVSSDDPVHFACFHDYTADYAAHLGNTPTGTTAMRSAINFPEGPLRAGAPRPDSSENTFCLTCHHSAGKGGLTLDALTLDPATLAEHDPRRQPNQPPRRVFGNIPAGWIPPVAGAAPGSPAAASVAPPEGALIDPWVLSAL